MISITQFLAEIDLQPRGFFNVPNLKDDIVPVKINGIDVNMTRENFLKLHQQYAKDMEKNTQNIRAAKPVVKNVIGQERQPKVGKPGVVQDQPQTGVVAKTTKAITKQEPVTPPRIKTSAVDDLATGAKNIGSGLAKTAESATEMAGRGVSAVGKGISTIGQYAQENPGTAALVAGGTGLAALLSNKLFRKPK